MGYKSFEGDYVVSKPMCEDPSTLSEEFLCFVLSISFRIHVAVCDGGANMICDSNEGGTRKFDVLWLVKEFGMPH